jgi:ferritin-like metal-binding protein YciE
VALATALRKAEHFEISTYGSLCTWARELDLENVLQLLEQNMREERAADRELGQLAQASTPEPDHLEKIFHTRLREMYDAEHLLAQALDELEFYSVSKLLRFAFRHHASQTDKHVTRLEKVFKELQMQLDRRRSKGIEGIIDDAQVLVLEFLGNSALDAALIAAGQKAERFEIITYHGLCTAAEVLGEAEVLSLLEQNLSDEQETDKALTLLAISSLNQEALEHDSPKKTQEEAEFAKAITHGP